MHIGLRMVLVVGACLFSQHTHAATLFFDDFNAGANATWGNDTGNWTAAGGVYNAQVPSTTPNAHSLVSPFTLADATVTVTVNNSDDGGVWMHASNVASPTGVQGVLLVTRPNFLYWHVVTPAGYGSTFALNTFSASASYSLKVVAQGNLYSAYVDNILVTTLNNNTFASGLSGLYDFSSIQNFDNFRIEVPGEVPLPAALPLFATVLAGGGLIAWRRKRKQSQQLAI